MPGVLIFSNGFNHYSFVVFDDGLYDAVREGMPKYGNQILWERGNVSLQQIDDAQTTKDALVTKLNEGQKVDLEGELSPFFQ